ncbi:MAG: indolepyruvate ferredoxin oxidoreductase subunit alpha [Armatimonadia bacterium]|nr:indolepyruvate ferredoxin oxidoreductase subunit alpha [Armatimonadia bacterium]
MLLSGNEAVALGAWQAGCRVAAAYPGTPSSEILPAFLECRERLGGEVYAEWSTNEKVALEVGAGASMAGARSLVTMKHVGLNVAADPFFTLAYTGVGAGLVIISADDPGMHSSQNEQDNRIYARHAHVPLLEPSDSQEACDFTRLAFEISEESDLPVLVRLTTRVCHSRTVVEFQVSRSVRTPEGPAVDPAKYVMIPANARARRATLGARLARAGQRGTLDDLTVEQDGDGDVGFITSGLGYQHLREILPGVPVLKLGMPYPLPEDRVRDFAERHDRTVVVEELEPFLAESLLAAHVEVEGLPEWLHEGELTPSRLAAGLLKLGVDVGPGWTGGEPTPKPRGLPPRPPVLCPGCAHRAAFSVLDKHDVFVTGDIGCYTLAALPPLCGLHSCLAMGAGVSQAHGIAKAMDGQQPVVAVIGDSTFTHMGLPALLNAVYNRGNLTVLILDNRSTAMTGGQDHPGTGATLSGEPAPAFDFAAVARAMGVESVHEIAIDDLNGMDSAMTRSIAHDGPSVIVVTGPCPLRYDVRAEPYRIEPEECILCNRCLRIGCPAIGLTADGASKRPVIDETLCTGCALCAEICPVDAIERREEGDVHA